MTTAAVRAAPLVDVLTPNQAEALALTGLLARDALARPAGRPATCGTLRRRARSIVTRGRRRAASSMTGHAASIVPASPVEAVDTVGAGDAFNGALAAALAEGRPCVDAAAWASAAAALAVTQPGAQAALPSPRRDRSTSPPAHRIRPDPLRASSLRRDEPGRRNDPHDAPTSPSRSPSVVLAVTWSLRSGRRGLAAHDRPCGPLHKTRSAVIARHGMAATSQPLATAAAHPGLPGRRQRGRRGDRRQRGARRRRADVLRARRRPLRDRLGRETKKLYGLNASGRAPYAATIESSARRDSAQIPDAGPLSWSVPGCVDGWDQLRRGSARSRWAELLAPGDRLRRGGLPRQRDHRRRLARPPRPRWRRVPTSAACFLPDGQAPQTGEVFRNPGLARSLRLIADDGRDAFYRGPIAEAMVAYSRQVGGLFDREDFEDHTSTWVEPVSTNYRGYDVWELPPNGQGIAALQMLNLLEPYDLKSLGPQSAEALHLMIEAKKLAYEDRGQVLRRPGVRQGPGRGADLQGLRRASAPPDPTATGPTTAPMPGDPGEADTIYLTVVDKDCNASA